MIPAGTLEVYPAGVDGYDCAETTTYIWLRVGRTGTNRPHGTANGQWRDKGEKDAYSSAFGDGTLEILYIPETTRQQYL